MKLARTKNNESQQSATIGRAGWTKELVHFLCDLCLKNVEKSKGKNGGVTSQRLVWKRIEVNFVKHTNLHWDKVKLKHKLDWMRHKWGLWKLLKGNETELRWDPVKNTVDATDEWWNMKIKENSKFEALREEGIEPELAYKMDQMFGFYAQGALKYTPVSDLTQSHMQAEDDNVYVPSPPRSDTHGNHVDDIDATYGGSTREAWDDVWGDDSPPPISPIGTQNERYETRNDKRVEVNDAPQSNKSARIETSKRAGETKSLGEKLDSMMQLIGERNNTSKGVHMSIMSVMDSMVKPKDDEIIDALAKLCALDLDPSTPEFYFACTMIEDPQKRSILLGLPNDKMRVEYIKFVYAERNKI
ncbi:unnamed protein product [Cuscuta europaea]|uniref:Myb/SANT-like domain-containing protein n=1 Tax=Cuscuta europaea TaxID=41803 RepID=A0A9P1E8Q9_CUSEU|nr:unnamed protein product [Cuscuta europaea]